MTDEKKPLPEDDGTDPLSLSNLILNKDMRKTGFNWTHYGPGRPKSAEETLVTEPIANASVTPGVFIKEAKGKEHVHVFEDDKGTLSYYKNDGANCPYCRPGCPDCVVQEAMVAPASAATSPTSAQQAGAGMATPSMGVEANNLDPTVVSSDPKFNACPAYLQSMCRIDGRPCPFSNIDKTECGKYYLAGSGDPQLFEIPPGREDSQEYQQGIKA
jgi:hypothetical protein